MTISATTLDQSFAAPELEDEPYVPMMDAIAAAMALSKADNRIVEELSKSVDSLKQCLTTAQGVKSRKPALEAQIISRRVGALKELAKILDDIRDRTSEGQEVQIIGMVVRLAREAMRESGIPNEARELIVQNLAMKIEEEDVRKRRLARAGK